MAERAFETDFWKHADLWEPDAVIARGPLICKGWRFVIGRCPQPPSANRGEILGHRLASATSN